VTFIATAGRIQVTDADGVKKLDTNDDLFHVVGNPINGSRSFPQIALNDGNLFTETTAFNIGTCHAACTHIIGAVKFNGSDGGAVGFDRWTTYMGGTLIWVLSSPPKLRNGNYGTSLGDFVGYWFTCSGGVVRLHKQTIFLAGPQDNIAFLRAHSIQWRLKAGLFT